MLDKDAIKTEITRNSIYVDGEILLQQKNLKWMKMDLF